MKFSPVTGCFYPADIAYPEGKIPSDAIETTREQFLAYCNAPAGSTISVIDGTIAIAPPAPPTLDAIKAAKIAALTGIYNDAVASDVTLETADGATAKFSRDAKAKAMVDLAVEQGAFAWTANVWIDASNAPVMPFSFGDIQALQAALAAPTSPSLADLMAKVAAVHAAEDSAAVDDATF
ncbi:hypothetical protein [Sphingomonas sp. UYP23]